MVQVEEVICSDYVGNAVNEWIRENPTVTVKDIKYTTYAATEIGTSGYEYIDNKHCALIIYDTCEPVVEVPLVEMKYMIDSIMSNTMYEVKCMMDKVIKEQYRENTLTGGK